MRYLSACIALFFVCNNVSSQTLNKVTKAIKDDKEIEILLGKCNRDGFKLVDFMNDYNTEYPAYTVNDTVLNAIKGKISDYTVKIFMGSWCGDSKEQVPRFLKILDKCNFTAYEIICVDRQKLAGDIDISALKIELVPTFVMYKNGVDVGRIVETPKASLEKDLFAIISK